MVILDSIERNDKISLERHIHKLKTVKKKEDERVSSIRKLVIFGFSSSRA